MKIMTYNEILIFLADEFDSFLAEKTNLRLERSNTNTLYLLLKAIAKGYEVINNTVYSLSTKFDPERCDAADLDSSARLVGTERKAGKQSGMRVDIVNNSLNNPQTLLAGQYSLSITGNEKFILIVTEDITIEVTKSVSVAALSEEVGSFYVTEIAGAPFVSDTGQAIPSSLVFNVQDNATLLGFQEESDEEFRERILTKTDRRGAITLLQDSLEEIPSIFNAYVRFNETNDTVVIGGRNVPAGHLIVFLNGAVVSDVAKTIASSSYFPTASLEGISGEVSFEDVVFISGSYKVNYFPFSTTEYGVKITVSFDNALVQIEDIRESVNSVLESLRSQNVSQKKITESDFYALLSTLSIQSLRFVTLQIVNKEGEAIPFVEESEGTLVVLSSISVEEES